MIAATRTTQFVPGTRYSYCNQNFRLIGDLLAERSGLDFAELLRRHVLAPAGMESAVLAADTRAMPDGTEGYEGTVATGFRAAENRVDLDRRRGSRRQPRRHDRVGASDRRHARRSRPRSTPACRRRSPSPTARRRPTASASRATVANSATR